MTAPTKPCKIGPRHKWTWLKNIASSQVGGRGTYAHFTLRGLYRCECGAKKVGRADNSGADLRDLFEQQKDHRP